MNGSYSDPHTTIRAALLLAESLRLRDLHVEEVGAGRPCRLHGYCIQRLSRHFNRVTACAYPADRRLCKVCMRYVVSSGVHEMLLPSNMSTYVDLSASRAASLY